MELATTQSPWRLTRLINELQANLTAGGQMESFIGTHPARTLVAPSPASAASLHVLFMPPGTVQPLHSHPDARCLLCFTGSRLIIETTPKFSPTGALAACVAPADAIVTVVLEAGEFHRFSVGPEGDGVVAFAFHPTNRGVGGMQIGGILDQMTTLAAV